MTDPDTLARNRWLAMSAVRLAGAATAVFGLVSVAGRSDVPPEAGIALVLLGMAAFELAPRWLSRRWRSPRP